MSFSDYLRMERDEMLRHKWIESEKAGYDLGQAALLDWVHRHAHAFRTHMLQTYGPVTC